MKYVKHLFICLMLVVFIGCIHQSAIVQNDYGAENLELVVEGLVKIKMVSYVKEEIEPKIAYTIGIPFNDNYILALDHCINFLPKMTVSTPFGGVHMVLVLEKREYFIDDKPIEFVGSIDDIAIMKSNVIRDYSFEFGDSDKIRIGDKVVMTGFSFSKFINVKDGIISKVDLKNEFKCTRKDCGGINSFLHSTPSNPGDSGCPLFIRRNGRLIIIGIINASLLDSQGLSFALKSNYVLKTINDILEKNND